MTLSVSHMKPQQSTRRLEKFIVYVLGRRPDEFGLVPEADGWVKLKDLLKAINEEDGWRHVRRSHIDEIVLTQPAPEIEINDNRVRARFREHLPVPQPVDRPPKLLYTCIRRRAYFVVLEKGITAAEGEKVVLAAAPDLALRIGRRRDPHPVLLTVNVEQALIAWHRPSPFRGTDLPRRCHSLRLLHRSAAAEGKTGCRKTGGGARKSVPP